ncbi:MAG: 3-dehydroquinate synthase [Treponema sp.]|nr:3-dehydroquinate synthase [Treponema sp.]
MSNNSFSISYPKTYLSTDISKINFLTGTPDLISTFKPGEETKERRFFVTDATVASLPFMVPFISKFEDSKCGNDCLIILGSGEPYKTIDSVLRIVTGAIEADFTRNDLFIGIGGGVICDITAFAASIFKRGAKVEFVPTTLLAMVDASIGGKTGCDFANYKNMIGAFYPARQLYYWPEFLQSLPENQYNSGLAEAFKTAVLFDQELFDIFENSSEKILSRDSQTLDIIIRKCVAAKAKIVEEDFTEKGIRTYLNLGHTYGHAFETIAGLGAVTHGQAVAWGIGRAVTLSHNKGYCLENFRDRIFEVMKLYNWETSAIPSVLKGTAIGERFLTAMHKDKKNLTSKVKIIIPKAICDIVPEEIDDSEILLSLKDN